MWQCVTGCEVNATISSTEHRIWWTHCQCSSWRCTSHLQYLSQISPVWAILVCICISHSYTLSPLCICILYLYFVLCICEFPTTDDAESGPVWTLSCLYTLHLPPDFSSSSSSDKTARSELQVQWLTSNALKTALNWQSGLLILYLYSFDIFWPCDSQLESAKTEKDNSLVFAKYKIQMTRKGVWDVK